MASYVLARGKDVIETIVSRDPRHVAWGYKFTFRVLLGSLMMSCRSGRRTKGEGETDATGGGFGAGAGEDAESRFWSWCWLELKGISTVRKSY